MNDNYIIYHLEDLDGNIFYVGLTKVGLARRKCGHIAETKFRNKHKCHTAKTKRIEDINYKFILKKVCGARGYMSAFPKERRVINKYKKDGIVLTNHPVKNSLFLSEAEIFEPSKAIA